MTTGKPPLNLPSTRIFGIAACEDDALMLVMSGLRKCNFLTPRSAMSARSTAYPM
jgi:hypothetical protein